MSFWDHLFDNEYKQRRDIELLRDVAHEQTLDQMNAVRRADDHAVALGRRIDRLELLCEGLIEVLKNRGGLTADELTLAITRVDLRDGVEDGRLDPTAHAQAPTCPACSRPVNPRRKACVFCSAELPAEMTAKPAKKAVRRVKCVSCLTPTPESEVFFSDTGMVCTLCFTD